MPSAHNLLHDNDLSGQLEDPDWQRGQQDARGGPRLELQLSDAAPSGVKGNDPIGYQRVYGTDDRPIDVLAEVRSGDVVLVPHGWHGPAMAPPGYDMYYLNVMAGPGVEREWLITDDPQHGWVRELWANQQIDPRLPFGGEES